MLQRPIGIWVLQATAMPSVLIETGFISNPDEEAYLNSDEGQNEISACIVRALRKYLTFIEQKQVTETSQASAPLFLPRNNTSTLDFLKEIANNEQSSYPR